jgi:hypothetical protein
MGGGAGIQITLELEQFYVARKKNRRDELKVVTFPELARWHAQGYMDGMSDIRGDMLKVKELRLDKLEEGDAEWLTGQGIKPGECLAAWIEERQWPHTCIFRGWIRGKWQDAFPLSIDFDLYVETLGYRRAAIVVEPADMQEFGNFWEDVFSWFPEDPEDEREDEIHWEDVRGNYGAREVVCA